MRKALADFIRARIAAMDDDEIIKVGLTLEGGAAPEPKRPRSVARHVQSALTSFDNETAAAINAGAKTMGDLAKTVNGTRAMIASSLRRLKKAGRVAQDGERRFAVYRTL